MMLLLLQAATATSAPAAPPMPAGTPWWVPAILAALAILTPVLTVWLTKRRNANVTKLVKDVASHGSTLTEHGATLAALRQATEGAAEKTDPAVAMGRERRLHDLETRVAHVEQETKDLKVKAERRAEEDARADRELERELGRIAGMLEVQNGSGGTRPRRG